MHRKTQVYRTQCAASLVTFKGFYFLENNVRILKYVEHGKKYSLILPNEDVH